MRGSLISSLLLPLMLSITFVSAPDLVRADADEAARAHFESGARYFDRGEYEGAIREFKAAQELSERPELLYNLYLSHERLGQYREAAETLAGYLEQVDDVGERERLEMRLDSLHRRVAELDEEEAARVAEEPPTTPVPSSRSMPLPALISFGAGGAGLLTFGIAGGLALAEDNALADRCGVNADRTCTDGDVSKLERRNTVANIGIGVAAVGVTAGLVLYFALRDRGKTGDATSKLRLTHDGFALSF